MNMIHTHFRSFVSSCLAGVLLLGTLSSCAKSAENGKGENQSTPSAVTENSETELLQDSLPDDLDFKDREVTFLSRYREGWSSGEIAVEELTHEPVNDAVYERNRKVEERLHIRIKSIEDHDGDPNVVITKIAKAVRTKTKDYDILAAPCFTAVTESLKGTFSDIRKSQYLDYKKPWWSQGFNDVIEYHGSQYTATGAALLSMYRFSFVTVFNKDLFTETNTPFLYDTVEDGKWTIDYQASLIPRFHQDNGNGKQDKEEDVYGFVTGNLISVDPYWSSCEIPIIRKDEGGDYVYVFEPERLHTLTEKLMNMFYHNGDATYIYNPGPLDAEQEDIRQMFADGWAAMATIRLMETESGAIRNMTGKFGIVPMPKFDEQQDGYHTLMHDQFTVLSIPVYIQDGELNMMGAVLEAMASDSYDHLKPAYYELTLRTKIAQDPESAHMLDIVMDNIYIDAGVIYTSSLGSFHNYFREIMQKKQNTVISTYKSVSRRMNTYLSRMAQKLDKLRQE